MKQAKPDVAQEYTIWECPAGHRQQHNGYSPESTVVYCNIGRCRDRMRRVIAVWGGA